jgi:hypothetical protein
MDGLSRRRFVLLKKTALRSIKRQRHGIITFSDDDTQWALVVCSAAFYGTFFFRFSWLAAQVLLD